MRAAENTGLTVSGIKMHWTVDVIKVSNWFLSHKALGALTVMSGVVISLSYHYLHTAWVHGIAWPETLLTNAQQRFSSFIWLRSKNIHFRAAENSVNTTTVLCLSVNATLSHSDVQWRKQHRNVTWRKLSGLSLIMKKSSKWQLLSQLGQKQSRQGVKGVLSNIDSLISHLKVHPLVIVVFVLVKIAWLPVSIDYLALCWCQNVISCKCTANKYFLRISLKSI